MNFFQSEEHLFNWRGFVSGTEDGILPLEAILKWFSTPVFSKRMDPQYISNLPEYGAASSEALKEILMEFGRSGSVDFWSMNED